MTKANLEITAEDKTAAAIKSADSNFKGLQSRLNAVSGLVGVTSAGAFALLTKKALETSESVAELARNTNLSNRALQEFGVVNAGNGGSVDTFNSAIEHFNNLIGDAANGSDKAVSALARVGIKVQDLKSQSIEELFTRASDSLAHYSDTGTRASVVQDLFGKQARSSAASFSIARDELAQLRREASASGQVLDDVTIANAKKAKDELDAMSRVISVQATQALVQWAPLLIKTTKFISDLGDMAATAARHIGLLTPTTEEQEYQFLLERRLNLSEAIYNLENSKFSWMDKITFRSDSVKQHLTEMKEKLVEIDKQILEMNTRQGKGDAANTPPMPAVVGDIKATEQGKNQEDKFAAAIGSHQAKVEEQMRTRMESIRESLMTERELEIQHHQEKLYDLTLAWEAQIITEEEYRARSEALETQHQARLGDVFSQGVLERKRFEQMNVTQQSQFVIGELLNLTQGVAAHNKTMFQINKVAGIANAIINTSLGVTKALSSYPPPLSIAMAAVQFAAGMAQVQQIKNAQFGSATSAPSVGGGAATPVTDVGRVPEVPDLRSQSKAEERPMSNVTIQVKSRSMLSAEFVRDELFPQIQEALGDRVNLNVALV